MPRGPEKTSPPGSRPAIPRNRAFSKSAAPPKKAIAIFTEKWCNAFGLDMKDYSLRITGGESVFQGASFYSKTVAAAGGKSFPSGIRGPIQGE
jgi:hypothetical protein